MASKAKTLDVGDVVNIDRTGKPWEIVELDANVATLKSVDDTWAKLTRKVDTYRLTKAPEAKS